MCHDKNHIYMTGKDQNDNHEPNTKIPVGGRGVRRSRYAGALGGVLTSLVILLTAVKPQIDKALDNWKEIQIQTDPALRRKLEEVTDRMIEAKGRGLFLIQQNDELKTEIKMINEAIAVLNQKQAEYLAALQDCQQKLIKCGVKK